MQLFAPFYFQLLNILNSKIAKQAQALTDLQTCQNLKCKLHPINHDLGCTPCIEKNLKSDEMPNCFYNKVDPEYKRTGTKVRDFAEFVVKNL